MIESFLFEIQNIWRSYEKDIEKSDDRPACGSGSACGRFGMDVQKRDSDIEFDSEGR